MLRAFLVLLVLIAMALPCVAGVGHMVVSADAEGNQCFMFNNGGGALVYTYVVHRLFYGDQAYGSHFGIEGPGSAWTFISFTSPFIGIPAAQADVAVSYGACMTATFTVGTALWLATSAPPNCSYVSLTAAPSLQTVMVADCAFNELPGDAFNRLLVNPDPYVPYCSCAHATEPSTWGSVKALYR